MALIAGWEILGCGVGNISDLDENGWMECVFFLYRNERMSMFGLCADLYIKRYENKQDRKNGELILFSNYDYFHF